MALSSGARGAIIAGTVAGALVVVLTLVVGFITLMWSVVTSIGQPTERALFDISEPRCIIVSPTEVLIGLAVASKEPDQTDFVRVQDVAVDGGLPHGAGTIAPSTDLAHLSEAEHAALYAQLFDDRNYFDVGTSTSVVLRVERATGSTVSVSGFTFWYAEGEPAFTQHVRLHVSWADDCTVALG